MKYLISPRFHVIFAAMICTTVFSPVSQAVADISLPKIFTDKMVLQRDTQINIWGTADAGEALTITLADKSVSATANEDGKWSAKVESPPAGGPYELVVAGKESQVVFRDVLVGEVWLCSGQSNMQWPLTASLDIADKDELEKLIAGINDSKLRLFTVPANAVEKPVDDFVQTTLWQDCTPETVKDFSGTAYLFAKALRENENLADMPIGLIDSSWGGTPCEAWASRTAQQSVESLAPLIKHWDERNDPIGPHHPGSLFNGMISPLIPMSIRGVIWYQGESNVGRGFQYATLFPTMIRDWRKRFGQGDLPFYFVQLAPFRYQQEDPRQLPEVWEAQAKALKLPNTGMAASIDRGNLTDIHPKNKREVARRLALIARAQDYGESDLVFSGPMYDSHEFSEDKSRVLITFSNARGLEMINESVTGFTVCGEDQQFLPAKATIKDGRVEVWSDEVPNPVAVRYLWDDSATASLANEAGLPASPFRTDSFEMLSRDRDF